MEEVLILSVWVGDFRALFSPASPLAGPCHCSGACRDSSQPDSPPWESSTRAALLSLHLNLADSWGHRRRAASVGEYLKLPSTVRPLPSFSEKLHGCPCLPCLCQASPGPCAVAVPLCFDTFPMGHPELGVLPEKGPSPPPGAQACRLSLQAPTRQTEDPLWFSSSASFPGPQPQAPRLLWSSGCRVPSHPRSTGCSSSS